MSEKGRVAKMRKTEPMTMRWAQIPWPSSHAETHRVLEL